MAQRLGRGLHAPPAARSRGREAERPTSKSALAPPPSASASLLLPDQSLRVCSECGTPKRPRPKRCRRTGKVRRTLQQAEGLSLGALFDVILFFLYLPYSLSRSARRMLTYRKTNKVWQSETSAVVSGRFGLGSERGFLVDWFWLRSRLILTSRLAWKSDRWVI